MVIYNHTKTYHWKITRLPVYVLTPWDNVKAKSAREPYASIVVLTEHLEILRKYTVVSSKGKRKDNLQILFYDFFSKRSLLSVLQMSFLFII